MVSGLDVRYGDPAGHPLVGARMPDLPLGPGLDTGSTARATTTTALLRSGHGLLLDLARDPARASYLRELVAACGVPVRPVSATPLFDGTLPTAGLDTVLVRPDGYVAWAGAAADDPTGPLRRWFG
jgi:hypothetical protein